MITKTINNFKSKKGSIGTLIIHSFVAKQATKTIKGDVAEGETFTTVTWEANPKFIPVSNKSDWDYETQEAILPLITMKALCDELTPSGAMVFFGKGSVASQDAESFPVF
jgi:hypothetical protein